MSVLMLGGSAIVPSLLLLWYVYARDKNPEPRGLLWKTFLLGAVICVPVVPVAMLLEKLGQGMMVNPVGSAFVQAFLGAAIPEELFKFLVLRAFVWRQSHFDEPLDGVVYGATASLGFATLENILYVGQHGMAVAVLRALTAVPGHAFTGVVMGAFVGRARFAPPEQRTGLLVAGLGSAILLHGAYDAFLFYGSAAALLALGVLFIEVRWGRRLYKVLQTEQVLAVPVMGGPLVAMAVPVSSEPLGPERTFWSWTKLTLGGLGLSLCGIWWLAVIAVVFFPDAPAPQEEFQRAGEVLLMVFSLLPTLLCGALFRSGLRGPFTLAVGG